jgi:hypothetical protein
MSAELISRFKWLAVCLLCFGLFSGLARAQSTTQGAIAGTVVDASGAVIPGAAITLHNDGTSAEFKLVSDESGYFKAPLVPPGTYTVTIVAAGFGTYDAKLVPVTVGSLTQLHPELRAGATQESVEVTGVAPVIQFESPEVSSTLTTQEIVNLPLNGGRWSNLALLTPGAASDSNGFGLISFRGISPILNNIEIDGADNNQAFFSEERGRTRAGYSTSQIAIAEFQVNTGVYSAEYGRSAGGVLNAVTKSGSNQLHGQAYFYDRDNSWGALNPFTTITRVVLPSGGGAPTFPNSSYRPVDWRKRWGFGAGGKLIENKLFWFYAYDQFNGISPAWPSHQALQRFSITGLMSVCLMVRSAVPYRQPREQPRRRMPSTPARVRPGIWKPAHWPIVSMEQAIRPTMRWQRRSSINCCLESQYLR